jgi:glycosyltransferase involved in cell wall biosynthesis
MQERGLVIVETHPVQYHAPVYHVIARAFDIPVHVIYGSDFSVTGYFDKEFQHEFAWSNSLVTGEASCQFLSQSSHGGARSVDEVNARGLWNALTCARPRVVLVVGYRPNLYLWAIAWARLQGIPILFRAETIDRRDSIGTAKGRFRDVTLRSLYAICNRLLPIGQRSLEHYLRLGCRREHLIASPYCVNTATFESDEEARQQWRLRTRYELGASADSIVLLFCGKLGLHKGVDIFIESVKSLPNSLRERVIVAFVGDGPARQLLDARASEDPKVAVRFIGFKYQHQLSSYYHAADLFVLPSHSETWGLVVNEALHHGVPCVVSDQVGCAPDLVEPGATGEIAQAGSAESLARAIERAMHLVGKETTVEACVNKVAGYTVHAAAAGIARAYQSVCCTAA